jgi:hypothetical protein
MKEQFVGKLILICALTAALHGCTDEDARQFAEGYNRGYAQSAQTMRENNCDPGSSCFAQLSPEAQQQLIANRQKKQITCVTSGPLTECQESTNPQH